MVGSADGDKTVQGQIVRVRDADWDPPYSEPVTAAVDCPLTGPVAAVTANAAVEAEAGILTEEGIDRAGWSPETATATPPAGAGLVSVIVQILVEPPLRLVGLHDNVERAAGFRFKATVVVERSAPPVLKLAVILALWPFVTAAALAAKVADVVPAGTDTEAGTVNEELLLESATTVPLAEGWFRVTVQVVEAPELTLVEMQAKEETGCDIDVTVTL